MVMGSGELPGRGTTTAPTFLHHGVGDPEHGHREYVGMLL